MSRSRWDPNAEPPLRLVIADADADTRQLYREALRDRPLVVVETDDGRDALVQCLMERTDLLIAESRLPNIDGYELCQLLRRDAATKALPILVVTSEGHPARQARLRQAGATRILEKPISIDRFTSEVVQLCECGYLVGASEGSDALDEALPPDHRADAARAASKTYRRFETTEPPNAPPLLHCRSCDRPLEYRRSRIGGVTQGHAEQWDQYRCRQCCQEFEYRHRTRRIRLVS